MSDSIGQGPFPSVDAQQRLVKFCLEEAEDEADKSAIKLYYSQTGNHAIVEAVKQDLESMGETVDFAMDIFRKAFEEDEALRYGTSSWEDVKEYLSDRVEDGCSLYR